MDKLFKLLENMQIWACVVVGVLLITTLFLLFNVTPKDTSTKIENELISLSESIRNQYKTKPDYWGLNKTNVVEFTPKNLIKNDKLISSVGREFIVGQNENGDIVMPSQRNFMITLSNLNKKTCRNVATINIDEHLSLQKIILRNGSDTTEFEWGRENSIPISRQIAKKQCSNKNSISWVFE